MRILQAVVFLAIALTSASASSDEPVVALAIEPDVVSAPASTLESAARANDFATFDALYRANPDPAYRTLHELWSYSMTDRIGAFYGNEQYERLSREYPGYAEYIGHYKIVDSHGEVFYPASETRAFLLEQRLEQRPKQRPAEVLPPVHPKKKERVTLLKQARATPVTVWSAEAVPPLSKAEAVPPHSTRSAPPVRVPVPAPAPAPAPAPVAPAPSPVVTEMSVPAPAKDTNRGLLLVIVGLVGVGLLALIVRAPREVIQ